MSGRHVASGLTLGSRGTSFALSQTMVRAVAIVSFTASLLLGIVTCSGQLSAFSTVGQLVSLALFMVAAVLFMVPRPGG